MNRALTFALISSAALHVGAMAAWYVPRERNPALPLLTASLRAAVTHFPPVTERTPAVVARAPVPKGEARKIETNQAQAKAPAATIAPAEPTAATEAMQLAPPAAVPAPHLDPPRYDAAYLANPPPTYPGLSKKRGIEGTVMLEVLVSPAGGASDIRLVASAGDSLLDEAARQAVRSWRFVPARRGAEAVEAWVRIPVVYKLN